MRSRNAILQELAREEARLAELERARAVKRESIESLRTELAAAYAAPPSLPLPPALDCRTPHTPAEKVSLF
ncbi:MAG: hypothetical protein WAW79_12005, partial [Steroidobacteraceae bacterium]